MNLINLLVLAVSVMLWGCSSIVSKSDYAVSINSVPQKTEFTIKNDKGQSVASGVTPATVLLKSSSGYFTGAKYVIEFINPEYAENVFVLGSEVDPWYYGNFIFGWSTGLVGFLVVDPLTGAMHKLPHRVDYTLSRPNIIVASDTTGE